MTQAGTLTQLAHRPPSGGADTPTPPPAPPAPAATDADRPPAAGRPDDIDLYQAATSFQEVRLRGPAALESFRGQFPDGSAPVRLFLDLHRSDPEAAHRLAEAVTAMPEVGTEFLGFFL